VGELVTVLELMARMRGDEKHAAPASSALDPIWVLYDRVLRVSPATLDDPDRDRFLLSKGHGPMAFYAVLRLQAGRRRRSTGPTTMRWRRRSTPSIRAVPGSWS
jgi:transketolase N-terminal domain/subunit